jgi:hypothetical protein
MTYDTNSIVDTLKQQGKDSSFEARSALAKEAGILNYDKSGSKNTELLAYLKSKGLSSANTVGTQQTIAQDTRSLAKTDTANTQKVDALVGNGKMVDIGNGLVVPENSPAHQNYIANIQGKGTTPTTPQGTTATGTPTAPGTAPATGAPIQITGSDKGTYFANSATPIDFELPPLADGQKRIYGADGSIYIDDGKGNVTPDQQANQAKQVADQKNKEIAERNAQYDSMLATLDSTHQTLVQSIKQMGERNRVAMEDLNKRTLGLKKTAGFRTGATEYTPEIAMGILKKEEEEGIQRISDIEAQTNLLIAEAVQAKTDKQFELLGKKMSQYDALQKEKQEAVRNIYKAHVDFTKTLSDQKKALLDEEKARLDMSIDEAKAIAPGAYSAYKKLTSDTAREAFLDELSKNTGIDKEILRGQVVAETPKPTKATGSGGNTGGYTDQELRKLRAKGIDPANTKIADDFLYNDVEPEESGAAKFTLDPTGGVDPKYNRRGKLKNEKDVTKVARELEAVGLTTDRILQIQKILDSGITKEELYNESDLTQAQKDVLDKYITEE